MKGVIRSAGKFFDLRDRFKNGLENIEKIVYTLQQELMELKFILDEMLLVSEKNQSYYFIKRVSRLLKIYQDLLDKKGYQQFEFNRLFFLLEKIRASDKIEFLNDSIKNRVEKIARSFTPDFTAKNEFSFQTFSFRSVNFMIKNYPVRILREGNQCDYILAEGKKIDIFPGYHFGITDPEDRTFFPGNLLIMKTGLGLGCYRYDALGPIYNLSSGNLQRSLKELPEKIGNISQFIKRRDTRYYLIPD